MTSTKITLARRVVLLTQTVKKRVVLASTNFAQNLDDVLKVVSITVVSLKPIPKSAFPIHPDVDTIG